ncbi:hypothetical protein PV761_06280 [Arthrobacter sp. CC3]|uniref:hypothetical protein n=1 Tax=Arthrobacter sp. CC3 TaxID=3029185 RepID=UPI003262EEC2
MTLGEKRPAEIAEPQAKDAVVVGIDFEVILLADEEEAGAQLPERFDDFAVKRDVGLSFAFAGKL